MTLLPRPKMPTTISLCRPLRRAAILFLFALAMGSGGPHGARAADPPPAEEAALDRSVLGAAESALEAERNALEAARAEAAEQARTQKAWSADIHVYRVQASANGNLLLIPDASMEDLERAQGLNRSALKALSERSEALVAARDRTSASLSAIRDQIALVQKQRQGVAKSDLDRDLRRKLESRTRELEKVLASREKIVDADLAAVERHLANVQEVLGLYQSLVAKYEERLPRQRARSLFERQRALQLISPAALTKEARQLQRRTSRWRDPAYWQTDVAPLLKSSGPVLLAGVLLYGLALFLLNRFRRRVANKLASEAMASRPWFSTVLTLVNRSLFVGAALALVGFLQAVSAPTEPLPILAPIAVALQGLLIYRWVADAVRLGQNDASPVFFIGHGRRFRVFALGYAAVATLHVWAETVLGPGAGLLFVLRLTAAAAFFLWGLTFWRSVETSSRSWIRLAAGTTHAVALSGLFMELTGWGNLAVHWFGAWTWTAAVAVWTVVGLRAILEWERAVAPDDTGSEASWSRPGDPIRWALIRCSWLLWAAGIVAAALAAWGGRQGVWDILYRIFNRSIAVGTLNLNLLGALYALLILFAVHVAVRLWKTVGVEKLLSNRTMDPGLRESITSISVYLIWALGTVVALGAVGVSATSLAVVFGALSIGIGFGLQNIFNNFISGLILLFERPIQVGDAVEINGTWGEIKKINVRATVVQTYDNASLIIPNSEFISSQVTNWSFKDKRLRRKVQVGVAYGSDVELTRKTLLEIAGQTPRVLKYPRPDVIFMDHGDSALIFVLRYWTTIDEIFVTETDIRFGIERLFRERRIEIAFPQQDVHIRSLPAGVPAFSESKMVSQQEDET